MVKIHFTADTHFSQDRALELSRRPFQDIAEMDGTLIDRWNSVVGPDDTVFHLGDFGKASSVFNLSGQRIYILPGNYDTPEILDELTKDPRVVALPTYATVRTPERAEALPDKLHLVHEPENGMDASAFYLFGHIHQLQMVKRNGLNVGADCHQFTPIDLAVVEFYYTAIMEHYDRNVFMDELA